MGRAMFQIAGVFAELERAMIVERVRSGLAKAKAKGTKSSRPIGRPSIPERKRQEIRNAYKAGGVGMRALDRERRPYRALGIVLLRHRIAEQRHQSITELLGDVTAHLSHCCRGGIEMGAHQFAPVLGI
jgi:DNA invertase Pin-like site-specific DNA recombinase